MEIRWIWRTLALSLLPDLLWPWMITPDRVISMDQIKQSILGGAHGVMVIVAGIGHGDMSSNPGRDWLHFT